MSGTHTHSGPGNLLGSNFYVMNAGNDGGLDLKFLEFITGQIADAIIEAYNNRKPARIATGSMEVYGFTRNRSIQAYQANKNADIEKANDIRKAVNPMMHMVRVDCLDEKTGAYIPAGAFTSFSIHGTSVPAKNNTFYNADVFAYIERELEWEMAKKHGATTFVHAVANGTHADNAPDITPGSLGFKESRRLGVGLGQKAIALFNSLAHNLRADVKIQAAIREIDYFKNNTIDGIEICDPPRVGNTLLAGASDGGPTPILSWLPFIREGSRRQIFTSGCQGNKRITAGSFQSLILPRNDFPHMITYQVIQLGNITFLPLPYEVTMESGQCIVEACTKSAIENGMNADTRFVVISVSNGYTGYCTTPEEYGKQRYEGGHTLYGPNTNPFVAAQTAKLVSDLLTKGEIRDISTEWTFNLTGRTFYQEYDTPKGKRATLVEPTQQMAVGGEECWMYSWIDVPPTLIDFHRQLVSIEYSEDGAEWLPLEEQGVRVDDNNYDLSVLFTGHITDTKLGAYEVRWYNPEMKNGRWYRFRIEPREGQEVFFSNAFK